MRLFDMMLEDGEHDAAATVLASLKEHHPAAAALEREVRLARARRDRASAMWALEQLCVAAGSDTESPLSTADRCFSEAGWGRDAHSIYGRALDQPDVLPQVAALWAERCVDRRDWRCPRRIKALLARGEIGLQAMEAYLKAIARERLRWHVEWCLLRHRKVIRGHTRCWATAGYALMMVARHRAAIKWLSDWPERPGVCPAALLNLAVSLRARRRVAEANRVSRRALELSPDHTTAHHRMWLALDDLIDADGREAPSRLEGIEPNRGDPIYRFLYKLAHLLLARLRAAPADRSAVRAATTRRLRELVRETGLSATYHAATVQTYRRALRRMAADHGPIRGLLWRIAWAQLAPGCAPDVVTWTSCDDAIPKGRSALADVGHVDPQGGGQVDLVLLLLDEDLADLLGEGEFPQGLALPDAVPVVPYRLVLVVQVEAKHVLGLLGHLDRLRRHRGRPAEVVDLLGDGERVRQLLAGVGLQLLGDVHILGAP